jgi:hypothetical protein
MTFAAFGEISNESRNIDESVAVVLYDYVGRFVGGLLRLRQILDATLVSTV